IRFLFNVQHDCAAGKCTTSLASAAVYQERRSLTRSLPTLAHSNDTEFVINTHGLHNAHFLRRFLPRHLTAP
ncbi:hypothetical protein AURDEDRAFT_25047, partial [Auricularia subglabra TFB-10046 SS5]